MTPDLVLFAIQSALKLGDASKKYQIDSIHTKELTLPYLNFDQVLDNARALDKYYLDDVYEEIHSEVVRKLATKLRTLGEDHLTEAEKRTLVYAYWKQGDIKEDEELASLQPCLVSSSTFHAFAIIKQYGRDQDPTVSVFKRLGGTFLEIGVDYFAHAPQGFTVDSREAIALKALFVGLDDVQFSEKHWKEQMGEFPRRLSVALLDTISENSMVFSTDLHSQSLIETTAKTLSEDVKGHIDQITASSAESTLAARKHIMSWGEVIFRSVLSSAGNMVAENPQTYFDLDDPAKSTLFKDLSTVLLNIVLDTEDGHLRQTFSKQSLDRLVKTTLTVIAKHPQLTGEHHAGVTTLITQVAEGLNAMDTVVHRNLLPEAIRLLIEKSGENLALLWPDEGNHEEKRILLLATKDLFENLSATTAGNDWKLRFAKDDMLSMLDTALKEVAVNPAWVVDSAHARNSYLGDAVKAMFTVINDLQDERITAQVGAQMLQSGLRAAAMRLEFLDDLPDGKKVIGSVFDAILVSVLSADTSSKVAWRLARGDMMQGLLDVALGKLQSEEITASQIETLRVSMNAQIEQINAGKRWSLEQFAISLEQALSKQGK
ncbi:MAG: Unknown protein [uncultured Thiotrichaceae bacterium]|uniref:Uncharacterized protein n=1 Tax=uncultured Thiotrichaceae bacterium TaxID=298394 RepID=A0A6S6UK28_9GAMM|nr:MAG: Unknown protein [uncultured Thiotrichaceae bacterium]